ncbi:Abcb10 [Symbiodinium necroappetens]|uniref:Abcb10 protein n=1 Tax=Symbiodinium necroappetens TaxID=1628268 RepID=A0A813CB12_9DINO|nr:Abcb10 [Symbiodinium necroappetens]
MAGTALQTSSKSIKDLADELDDYVERGPHRLNVLCFVGGAAIVLNGIFSVVDVFNVLSEPVYYVVNAYMVFFGAVTCITEARPTFAAQLHDTVQGVQRWMHEWAKGLTLLWGRGLFYIFQGAFCLLSSGLLSLGLIIGAYMLVIGLLCLKVGYRRHVQSTSADYIRITE